MKLTLLMSSLLVLSACATAPKYTCGVPENGVSCQPMDKTYEQLHDGSLVSLHAKPYTKKLAVDSLNTENSNAVEMGDSNGQNIASYSVEMPISVKSIKSKEAIFTPPREMRIWFDRFTDVDGDLHDESFVFIRIDNGHWVLDNKDVVY